MIAVGLVALGVVALLAGAYRAGTLWWASVLVMALAAVAFALALLALSADFREAGGFIDCNDRCSTLQVTVGVLLVAAPVAFVIALAAFLVGVSLARRHAR